jgi:hypothetical protein
MSSFEKLFKENTFLTEEGKEFLEPFQKALDAVFASPEGRELTISQIRILGSTLAHMVGDKVSNTIQERSDLTSKFNSMNDDEFKAYMEAKYGPRWIFISVTMEELERCTKLSENHAFSIMEESQKLFPPPSNGVRLK